MNFKLNSVNYLINFFKSLSDELYFNLNGSFKESIVKAGVDLTYACLKQQ